MKNRRRQVDNTKPWPVGEMKRQKRGGGSLNSQIMTEAFKHRKHYYVRPRHNLVRRNQLLISSSRSPSSMSSKHPELLAPKSPTFFGQTGTFTGADWGSLPATVEPLEPSERWDDTAGTNIA
ncbi:hypothetical protein U1Q18_015792 [Sarracenia purpurea var. burkii]